MSDSIQSTDRLLSIKFALEVEPAGMLAEDDEKLAELQPGQISLEDLEGQFRFELGDTVEIEDDISYLAWRLCLRAIPFLRKKQRYEMTFYNSSGGVVFEPVGNQTRMLVDGTEAGLYPSEELAAAMLACVRRLAHALERLGAGNPQVQAAAAALLDRTVELELG